MTLRQVQELLGHLVFHLTSVQVLLGHVEFHLMSGAGVAGSRGVSP